MSGNRDGRNETDNEPRVLYALEHLAGEWKERHGLQYHLSPISEHVNMKNAVLIALACD